MGYHKTESYHAKGVNHPRFARGVRTSRNIWAAATRLAQRGDHLSMRSIQHEAGLSCPTLVGYHLRRLGGYVTWTPGRHGTIRVVVPFAPAEGE